MSLNIKDHPESDYVEIEGIKFHYSFFQTFGIHGPKPGTILRIESRENDTITVSKLREEPDYKIGEIPA